MDGGLMFGLGNSQLNARDDADLARLRIGDLLDAAALEYSSREALVFGDTRLSYAELRQAVETCAAGFSAIGIEKGDHVALWMPNCLEWVYTFLALARIGAVTIPVNTGFRLEEAKFVVGQSDATALVISARPERADFVQMARDIASTGRLSTIVVTGDSPAEFENANAVSFSEVMAAGAGAGARERASTAAASVRASDPVIIFYTSGTTGFPKGAVHSHKLIRNMVSIARRLELTSDDTVVLYLPLFHVFASLSGLISFMFVGGKVVLMPQFVARESLELMAGERATVVYGMQPIYHDQISLPDYRDFDLSSVRVCITPAPPDFVRLVGRSMGKAITVYGMTETTAWTSVPSLGDPDDLAAETVGRPLDGFEVRIVSPNDRDELGSGQVGEIEVRGHQVMLGYYKRPAETDEVLSEDGWFSTGDLGSLSETGYLTFHGRLKDAFRVGGENVDPAEVEAAVAAHPAVALVAVIGIPDLRMGEVGVAFVQLQPGAELTAEALQSFVRDRLAGFKVPRRVVFVDDFPRTGSGKIQKFRLADLVQEP
jgi:fatty-acyl-CoA synthase